MKQVFFTIFILAVISFTASAQNKEAVKASSTGFLTKPILVPSIAKQIANGTFISIDPNEPVQPGRPKLQGSNNIVPGKGFPKGDDALVQNQMRTAKKSGRAPSLVFDADISQAGVSDPTGAVGPNHYIGAWNFAFRIFDKEGNPLTNEASLSTIFPGNAIGDPIVLYDAEADRFIITEFDSSPNGFNVAICQGPDPVNDDWYVYTSGFGTGSFPDYTKFSVWSDGYYVTANIGSSNRIFVVERDEMLLGNEAQFVALPLPGISTSGFYSPQFFNVGNPELPANGNATVVYLQDDAWGGVSEDHLKLWTVNVDWDNSSNSTVSQPIEMPTTAFTSVFDGGSFSNRPQPSGPDIDVLQATIMNQAQFRKFPDHNSAIFNFVVDVVGPGELAGIRWYELRQSADGEPWELYQEGTYVSPVNGKDAFSGSMAMDAQGNIGMGYTTVSSLENIAIYYTGRYANDPLGQMTVEETLIAQSTSNNPGNRLADYVHLTIDPTNDKSFWHIAEYFAPNRRDVVGVFQIAPNFVNDIGIASIDAPENGELGDAEEITVTVFNAGENEQSNFDIHFQVDNETVITESYIGTLDAQEYASFTFAQTADLGIIGTTYMIKAFTSLDGDEDMNNDTIMKSVKYIGPYDIGVASIDAPQTGEGLSETEDIIITVENFGTEELMNFDVSYLYEGNTITEVVPGPVSFGEQLSYTFNSQGDFSEGGVHYVTAYTSHANDSDLSNDTSYRTVLNSDCIPSGTCSGGHDIQLFQLGSINNESACSENGYGDYVGMSTELFTNSTNDLTISTGYGNQFVKVWIDFNDNFVFDEDEVVVDNFEIADGQNSGSYTETMSLSIPNGATLGEHLMRAKLSWLIPIGDDEACSDIAESGEIEDYMVNILQFVGLDREPLVDAEMIVANLGNNQFRVSLNSSELTKPLRIDLHNTMGQCLVHNRIPNINGTYTYDIDMSYAKPGVYIIRLGSDSYGKIKKIFVK